MMGETLQDIEDERLFAVSATVRRIVWAHLYAHLPNVEVDWELEGKTCCRVMEARCYENIIIKMKIHLKTDYHVVSRV
jgi:hypothetical protein